MKNQFLFFLKFIVLPLCALFIVYFFVSALSIPVTKVSDIEPNQELTPEVNIGEVFMYGFGEDPTWELNLLRSQDFAEVVLGNKRDNTIYNGYINYDSLSENNFVYQGAVKNNKSATTDIFTLELIPTKCKTQSGVDGKFAVKIFVGDKRFAGCANGKKM